MAHSSGKRRGKPQPPAKPSKDFPLYAHRAGWWAKKVRGSTRYFTRWVDDPKGEAALLKWLDQKDELLAGKEPRAKADPDGLVVSDLCFKFLAEKEEERDNGELSPRSWLSYYQTSQEIVGCFGRNRLVIDLARDDFRQLRKELAKGAIPPTGSKRVRKKRDLVALGNAITRVRTIFRWAFDAELISDPIRCLQSKTAFVKPKKRDIEVKREEQRAKHGDQMFEAADIRLMLDALAGKEVVVGDDEKTGKPIKVKQKQNPGLRAMVLLAANCAYGQSDIANLPTTAVAKALKTGWLDYGRGKTAVKRRIPLWPETADAINEWTAVRPAAKDEADKDLLFLTCNGVRFLRLNDKGYHIDGIGQEFKKLLIKLKLKRPRIGFYSFRHGFETIAGETGDQVVVDKVMGHKDGSMAATYRERISDERISRVLEFVRQWVFAGSAGPGGTAGQIANVAYLRNAADAAPAEPIRKKRKKPRANTQHSQNTQSSAVDAVRLRLRVVG